MNQAGRSGKYKILNIEYTRRKKQNKPKQKRVSPVTTLTVFHFEQEKPLLGVQADGIGSPVIERCAGVAVF